MTLPHTPIFPGSETKALRDPRSFWPLMCTCLARLMAATVSHKAGTLTTVSAVVRERGPRKSTCCFLFVATIFPHAFPHFTWCTYTALLPSASAASTTAVEVTFLHRSSCASFCLFLAHFICLATVHCGKQELEEMECGRSHGLRPLQSLLLLPPMH